MIYQLSQHARDQMQERAISAEVLDAVLQNPEQVVPSRKGRRIYQSLADIDGRTFLVRVVVVERTSPPTVATLYLTSRIQKYWQAPETKTPETEE